MTNSTDHTVSNERVVSDEALAIIQADPTLSEMIEHIYWAVVKVETSIMSAQENPMAKNMLKTFGLG